MKATLGGNDNRSVSLRRKDGQESFYSFGTLHALVGVEDNQVRLIRLGKHYVFPSGKIPTRNDLQQIMNDFAEGAYKRVLLLPVEEDA